MYNPFCALSVRAWSEKASQIFLPRAISFAAAWVSWRASKVGQRLLPILYGLLPLLIFLMALRPVG
jgi:hypothetical protein